MFQVIRMVMLTMEQKGRATVDLSDIYEGIGSK